MSLLNICRNLALVAILGYFSVKSSEATPFNNQQDLAANYGALQSLANNPALLNTLRNSVDSEDDDEDDDVGANIQQAANPPVPSYNYNEAQTPQESQYQAAAPISSSDLKTAASHHHHGHGVKGWLDMGAWTGKKGSFGWHDKHPVGKKGK